MNNMIFPPKTVSPDKQGDVPLEQAMHLYEEGIGLSRICAGKLKTAELALKRLSKDAEGNFSLTDEKE